MQREPQTQTETARKDTSTTWIHKRNIMLVVRLTKVAVSETTTFEICQFDSAVSIPHCGNAPFKAYIITVKNVFDEQMKQQHMSMNPPAEQATTAVDHVDADMPAVTRCRLTQ